MISLPDSLRSAFKDPFGPVYTDTEQLLAAVDEVAADSKTAVNTETAADSETAVDNETTQPPLIAVGDVVSYHLLTGGRQPDVAIIDGKTEREAVTREIETTLADPDGVVRHVENPPAELSRELLVALQEAIVSADPVTIIVDGEEDLATLPAIVAAPLGSSVIYGQPGEGMVHVAVTAAQQREARQLLGQFDGNTADALAVVDD